MVLEGVGSGVFILMIICFWETFTEFFILLTTVHAEHITPLYTSDNLQEKPREPQT